MHATVSKTHEQDQNGKVKTQLCSNIEYPEHPYPSKWNVPCGAALMKLCHLC